MKCEYCQKEFVQNVWNKKYCDFICHSKAKVDRDKKRKQKPYNDRLKAYKSFEEETKAVDEMLKMPYKPWERT